MNNCDNKKREGAEERDMRDVLDIMAEEMDEGFMETAKDLAGLFRVICMAAATLPEMDLKTDLMHVINDEHGLTVSFERPRADAESERVYGSGAHNHEDYDPNEDYEEEGMLYDGD